MWRILVYVFAAAMLSPGFANAAWIDSYIEGSRQVGVVLEDTASSHTYTLLVFDGSTTDSSVSVTISEDGGKLRLMKNRLALSPTNYRIGVVDDDLTTTAQPQRLLFLDSGSPNRIVKTKDAITELGDDEYVDYLAAELTVAKIQAEFPALTNPQARAFIDWFADRARIAAIKRANARRQAQITELEAHQIPED